MAEPARSHSTAPPKHSPHRVPSPKHGVTRRAVLLGLALTPFNCLWVLRMEEVMFGPFPSLISVFANTVFLLFLFIGLNRVLVRYTPRHAFTQSELLTLYTMLGISTAMAGQSGLNIVCGMITHGAWFSTPERGWNAFMGSFPDWMVIRNKEIVRGHYLGESSFYRMEVLQAWLVPILAWTLLFSLILLVACCVNILVRRQWADHERLTFPVIWLPLEMTEGGTGKPFFQNRLMWAGFAIAFGLTLYNGLAFLYPSLTPIPLGITDLKPLFTQKPWSAIDWFPVTFYPLAIGLCYLLPLDLLFSCWLFFLLWKAQLVLSNMMAWDSVPEFPFVKEQGFGAVMGLFLFYLWSGRKTYAALFKRGWEQKNSAIAEQEGLSDRMAIVGIVVGLVGLFAFGLAAKMTWWVILAFFTLYLALLLVVTRIRAECGSPVHDFTFMGPDNILSRALGTTTFRQSDLAFFALSYPLTYSRSNDPMPIALEAQQMARLKGIDARRLFRLMLFTIVFATLCTFWAYEHQAYQLGASAKWSAGTHFAQESYDRMSDWMGGSLDAKPNQKANVALLFGFVTTLCLMALRWRYFGFPLHPIGYAVSSAWAINLVWVPMIIAWMLKGLTLRYGGLRIYRMFIPFFLGLVLGDCVMGCTWGLLSLLLKMRTYNFFGA